MFKKKYKIEEDKDGYWAGYKRSIFGWFYISGTVSKSKYECKNLVRKAVMFDGNPRADYFSKEELRDEL